MDPFLALYAIEQARRVQGRQLSFVIGGKAGAGVFQPVQIAFKLGCIFASIKVIKVPFRQVAHGLIALACIGVTDRKG